jgi:beta-galactosidase
MLGFYRAMFEQNIPADFIHADEIVGGRASKYDVIYLSYPVMLPQIVAEALKGYVREGGTLISEARPGWNDDRGYANPRIPGFGLDEVFGAREKVLRSPESITFTGERFLEGPLAPLAGRTFNGLAFAEHLEITNPAARVLARFPAEGSATGDPAIVESRYGKGRAILIGSFPAAAFEEAPDATRATGELLQLLVASTGVTPEVRIEGAPGLVEARFLESSDALLLIAINHAETPQSVEMTFTPDTPEAIWQNMETGAAVHFVQGARGPVYRHAFAARDVMVLLRGKRLR